MLLMSWLSTLRNGLVRGHWKNRRRTGQKLSRRGEFAPVAVRTESLEDRALLAIPTVTQVTPIFGGTPAAPTVAQIDVTFSEAIAAARTGDFYVAAPGGARIPVTSVALSGGNTVASLSFATQSATGSYTVRVGNIASQANTNNVMAPFFGYTAPTIFNINATNSGSVRSTVSGNFNGDAFPDIVGLVDGTVQFLPGATGGTFGTAVQVLTQTDGYDLNAADFNGDGFLDLAYVKSSNASAAVLIARGNGDGTFQTPVSLPVPFVVGIDVGDIDGNGRPDIIAGPATSFFNNDTGTNLSFATWTRTDYTLPTTPVDPGARTAVLANFDGDADLDVLFLEPGNGTSGRFVYGENNGTGGFTFTNGQRANPNPQIMDYNSWVDVDNDGRPDLISSYYDTYVNYGDPVTILSSASPVSAIPGSGTAGFSGIINVGDVDGDGDIDLIRPMISDSSSLVVQISRNLGGRNFSVTNLAGLPGPQPYTLDSELLNLNADGIPDLVVADANTGVGTAGNRLATYYTQLNAANGTFTLGNPEINVTGNGAPIADGAITTSTGNHTSFANVPIDGASRNRTYTIQNTGPVALTISSITSTGPDAADFVVAGAPASVPANGSATFLVTFNPSTAGSKSATITITNNDLDEGSYDFAISGNALAAGPVLTFVEQTGTANPLNASTNNGWTRMGFADIDNDGDQDAFVGRENGGTIRFWRNDGTATAPSFVEVTGVGNPFNAFGFSRPDPSFADLDDDGDLDVIVGTNSGGVIRYFRNDGNATAPNFVEQSGVNNPLNFVTGLGNHSPDLVDIDHDGDFDVIDGGAFGYRFFRNDGTATTPSFVAVTGTGNPLFEYENFGNVSASLGDADGDGDFDLISGEFSFYVRNVGTAAAPDFIGVGAPGYNVTGTVPQHSAPVWVDIDADGRLDFFNPSGDGIVRFFRNMPPAETDVAVSGGNLVLSDVNGGTSNDTLTITRNGANLRISDPNNVLGAGTGATRIDDHTIEVPFASITGSLQISTSGGSDVLNLNLGNGDIIPAGGLVFDGGNPTTAPGDRLIVSGYNLANPNYTPSATTFGNGQIVTVYGTITFTGLEPVDFDGVGTVTLTLPGANDIVSLANGTIGVNPAVTISGTSGGVAFEVANVRNSAIVVNTTLVGGNDTITLTSVQATAGITDLTINTGTGTDTVAINGTTSITGNLSITSAGALTGAGNVTAGGTASLTTAGVNLTGVVTVTGTTSITAGASVVSLSNTANNFGGAVTVVSGGDTTLVDVNNLAVAGATLTGQFVTLSDQIEITGTVSTGANNILLQQSNTTAGGTIGLGNAATGNFNLDASEITFLSSSGTVTIGQGGGLGAVDINDLALAGETFSLLIRGGAMSLDSVTLAANKSLELRSSGSISDTNGAAANVTIAGANGAVLFDSATGVGTSDAIETAVGQVAARATAGGAIQISDADSVEVASVGGVNGINSNGSNIAVAAVGAGGVLTVSQPINAGAGQVTLIADDMSVGANVTGNAGILVRASTNGTTTLGTGVGGLALSDAELDQFVTTGTLTIGDLAVPAGSGVSVTAAVQANSAANLSVVSNGAIAFGAAGAITSGGGLTLSAASVTGNSGATTNVSGTTVSLLTTGTVGATGNAVSVGNGSALTLSVGAGTSYVSSAGTVTAASFSASGGGTLELSGSTFVTNGSNVVSDGTSLRVNGANYNTNTFSDTLAGLTLLAGSVTGTGTLTSTSAFALQGGSISANLAGGVGLNKTTGGTVVLSGTNTYTGSTVISDGTLQVGGTAIPNASLVDLQSATAILNLDASEAIGGLLGVAGSQVQLDGFTLTTDVTGTDRVFAGVISGAAAGSNLVKTGTARLTLTGTNTYVGTTAVNGGTLRIGDGVSNGALGNGAVSLASGTTIQFNPNTSYVVGNTITGGVGTTIQQLSGTTTLHNANSAATTTVVGGRLNVGGTSSGSLTSSVTVQNGGTLGMAAGGVGGTVTGTVTLLSGGSLVGGEATGLFTVTGLVTGATGSTIAAGNSPGILTLSGGLTTGGTLAFEVNPPATTAGTHYDQIQVTGAVNLAGATLTFSGGAGAVAVNQLVTLITNDSGDPTTAGTTPAEGGLVTIGANSYRLFYNGGDGNDVVLIEASQNATVYVDDSFTGNGGQVIADADLGTTGAQPAIFGVNAFTTINAAVAAATAAGTIIVNSGTYTTGTLSGTQTLRVTGPNAVGLVNIGSLTTAAGQFVDIVGSSILTVGDGTDSTIAGVIQGTGNLKKDGLGTVTLGGDNTYSGLTTVAQGTLSATVNNALGTTGGGTTVSSGAILDFNGVAYTTTEAVSLGGGAVSNGSAASSSSFAGAITLLANSFVASTTLGRTLTLSGVISHGGTSFGVIKSGNGTVELSGINTYTGTTTVTVGELALSGGAAIANVGAVNLNSSGASLTLNASETINQLQGVAGTTINLNTNTLTSNTGVTTTYAGSINGSGGLTKDGAGTLTLSGNNSFTGTTSILGGGLNLAGGSAIADTSAVVLANAAGVFVSLQANERIGSLAGGGTTGGSIFLNSNTLLTGDATNTQFSGNIGGSGGLTKLGSGTFTLTGTNTYTGTTTISDGSLTLNSAGGNALSDLTAVTLDTSGANLTLSTSETIGSLAGVAGTTVTLNGTLTAGGTNASTLFAGAANGAGGLTKVGTGTLTLSGSNGFTGPLTINAGGVTVSGGSAIGNGTAVVLANVSGAVLTLSASEQIGSLAGGGTTGGNVDLGGNLLTVGDGTSTIYGGVIGGSGGQLTKVGSGDLQLTGANTFTGAVTISGGSLTLNNAGGSALPDSTAVNIDTAGATLVLTTGETIGSLAGVAGSVVTLNANTLTTGGNNGTTAFGGAIGGTGGLTKTGSGTFTLTGANTYSGTTTISAGSVVLNNAGGNAINDLSNVDLNVGGANLTLSTNETIGSLTGTLGTTLSLGANTLTTATSANTTMQGVISGVGGSLVKNGTGELTLSAANTYTGTTTVGVGGSVRLFGTDGSLGGGNVSNSGTVRFERSTAYTVANNITGSGVIDQNGSGRVTLTGTNTAGAGTTVSFGRLDVNGTLASNVTVGAFGALGGTGTVTGNVTGAGVVAPGNSPGILNVVGTFGPVGSLSVEINGTTPGTQHDQVNVTGGVNLGGTTVLVIDTSTIASVPGQQLVLINNDLSDAITGTFSGQAEGSTVMVNGLPFVISYIGGLNGNDVTLTQAGVITITGTAAGDNILLQEETISGLDYVSYYLGGVLQTRWLSIAVTSITVNAGDGNDTLTVNYGASGGFFAKNITYNGGNQTSSPGDVLVLDDVGTPPTFTTITHSFTNNSDGSVNVDGTTITYTGLEPITDNLDAVNRVFTFTGANETISLTAAGAQSQLDSTLGESVVFTHPTTSLTINSTNGTDTINLSTIGAAFTANVTINSNAASTVDFNNATGLNVGAGNVVIDAAGTINFSAGSLTTTGNVTLSNVGTGGVTANAAGVDIAANGLTISSVGAIGTGVNPLRTSVTTVTSASTTGAGSAIVLTETDAVTLTSVTTTDGAITITAGGTVTATSVTAGGTARDVRITTTGGTSDIALGLVTAAGDLVSLNAGGAITDGNGPSNNIAAQFLALQATTGIGSSDPIETALTTLAQIAFVNTTSGDVQVTNTGALNVFTVDGIGGLGASASRNLGGSVTLQANAGALNLVQDLTAQVNVTLRAPEAPATGQNVVNFDTALVTATTGNVVVEAGDDIVGANFSPLRTIYAPAGHVRLRAGFSDTDGDGGLNFAANSWIEAGTYIALEIGSAADGAQDDATSRFIAPNLQLIGLGATGNNFNFAGTQSDVNTIAANTRGLVVFTDVDDLIVGSVTGIGTTTGINTSAATTGSVRLNTGTTLLIDDDIAVGSSAFVRLNAGGAVTQNANDDITGSRLGLTGTGPFTLDNAGNNVQFFAANPTSEVTFTNAAALHISNVDGLNGVNMGAANTLTLTTTGTITQEGAGIGPFQVGNARILGTGAVLLNIETQNNVGVLAINRTTGNVEFSDTDALSIGSVTGTLGASAGTTSGVVTTGSVTLMTASQALSLDRNVTATGGTARLQAATNVVQDGTNSVITANNLGVRAVAGLIDLDGLNQVSAAGEFASEAATTTVFRNVPGIQVGQISNQGDFTPTATGSTGTNIELVSTTGGISITRPIVGSGTVRLQAGSGPITQTGTGTVTAANLGARATGNIDLNTLTNQVTGNFAAVSTGTGFIEFLDAGGFTVGSVTAGQFFTAITGVTTNDGLIDLNTSGDLTVTDVVTAVGTSRNVTLTTTAGGNVSLNGIVTAAGDVVTINSAGNITDAPANTVNNITAIQVTLNAVTGIGATGLNGAIETTANLINATNTTSGGIFLNSVLGAPSVNFNSILAQGTGNIELTADNQAVLTTVNATSGNVTGVSAGQMTVASAVTAGGTGDVSLTTTTGGIVLNGTTTAIDDDVTMTSAVGITGNGLVTANTFTGLANSGTIGVSTGNRVQTAVNLIRMNATGSIFTNNVSPSLTTYSLLAPAGVGINSGAAIDLITSNDLTIANGARVLAIGAVSLQGGAGNTGATITLNDTVDGAGTPVVLGGGGNDDVIVNDMSGTTPINLNAQAGDDTYTINYFSGFMPSSTANINIVDSSSAAGDDDTVNIHGTDAVDNMNVKEDSWLGGSFRTLITGGHTGRVNYIAPTPSNARLTTLNVFGRDGQDNFFVSPSRYFTINVFGGNPFFGPTAGDVPQVGLGDTLDFDPNGQNFTIEGKTILTSSFGVAAPTFRGVTFSQIENLPLTPVASGTLYFDFDALPSTTNPLPEPPNYTPTQAGYQRVLTTDLYVDGNPTYTYLTAPYNTTYATRKFGWEALRDGSNNLIIDQNGNYMPPVEDFDSTVIGGSTSAYANLVRDGHWSGSDNTRKSIFRFEVPSAGANANKWYVASVKVIKPAGNVDQMRIRNADDPDSTFFLVNNITTSQNQVGEFKFPVKANGSGEIRLEFSDNGGSEGHWYVSSLELRPGQLLSFGAPPATLIGDGQTVDTHTIYGAVSGSVVTITTTMGTLITNGAFPDIDPIMEGLQRPVNGAGQAQFAMRRANAAGTALVLFNAIANGTEGTFENTGCQEITFLAPPLRRFDFGTSNSPVQTPAWSLATPDGYLPISAGSLYSASVAGAGWLTTGAWDQNTGLVSTSPYLSLIRDSNGDSSTRQFAFDLPAGSYQLTAIVGAVAVDGQNISVVSGGTGVDMSQVTNFTTTNGQFRSLHFTVNKTGTAPLVLQFNNVTPGKQWSVNALEVRTTGAVTGVTVTPPGGSLTADGTTVDVFNVNGSGIAAGTRLFTIATTLGTVSQINGAAIVDADPSIAGVQFDPAADTFTIQVTRPAGPGTATVTVDEVSGAARGSANQTYVAPAGPRRFDFGTTTSPVQAGYSQISPTTTYSSTGGWGWLNATDAIDRGVLAGAQLPDLIRDSAYAWNAGRFRVDLAPNSTYELTVTLGDSDPRDGVNVTYSTDGGTVFSSGVAGVNTNAGERTHRTFTVTTGATGSLILEFADGGGNFSLWSLSSLEVRAAVTPFTMSSIGSVGADGATIDNFNVTGATVGAVYTISATNGVITTADADPYYSGVQVVAPAANFGVQVRRPGSAGTNNVSISEVTGASRSTTGTATYTLAASRSFDFNVASVPVSPTAPGHLSVLTSTQYTGALGYGWVSTVGLDQRDYPAVADPALRDLHWHRTGAQFRVDVAGTGAAGSTITLRFRDPTARVFQVQVLDTANTPLSFSPNGGGNVTTHTYSVAANTTQTLTLTLASGYSAGNLKVNFIGRFSINAIQFSTPQLAAVDYVGDNADGITAADLDATVAVAKARWLTLPLTAEQKAVIDAATFQLSDFGADRHLGLAVDARTLKIDDDAAGYGWFVDASALDDSEFGTATGGALVATTGAAAGRFDLLTVVMHELGNALKLSGAGLPASAEVLALPMLDLGTRRLPGGTASIVAGESTSTTSNGSSSGTAIVLDDRTPFGTVKNTAAPAAAVAEAAEPPVALPKKTAGGESTDSDAFFASFGKQLDLLPF